MLVSEQREDRGYESHGSPYRWVVLSDIKKAVHEFIWAIRGTMHQIRVLSIRRRDKVPVDRTVRMDHHST